jgi:23S rRNA (pseudouridine1915-N3)-methyltransferase
MDIHLITVGTKMPAWVAAGYQEYAKRFPRECTLKLNEIAMPKRNKGAKTAVLVQQEGKKMVAQIPKGTHCVALEVKGNPWTTEQLAARMQNWMAEGKDVSLLIGGPDGIEPSLSRSAAEHWSISPLTLPHPLVRVVLAEQLYRAWTIINHHPYHRA